jgi:hypothetical protein
MCQALLEIMEPEINKIKENVKEEVTREGIRSLVTFLRDSGQGDIEIKNAVVKVYNVSVTEAESYL